MRAKPPQMPQKGLCIGKARLNSKVEDVRLMSARRHCAKRRNGRICGHGFLQPADARSEEHTSELQSLMRISYAVFCLKKKTTCNLSTYTDMNTITTRTLPS